MVEEVGREAGERIDAHIPDCWRHMSERETYRQVNNMLVHLHGAPW